MSFVLGLLFVIAGVVGTIARYSDTVRAFIEDVVLRGRDLFGPRRFSSLIAALASWPSIVLGVLIWMPLAFRYDIVTAVVGSALIWVVTLVLEARRSRKI